MKRSQENFIDYFVLAKNYDFRQRIFPLSEMNKFCILYNKNPMKNTWKLIYTYTHNHLNDTNLDFSIDYIIIENVRERKKIFVYVWLASRVKKKKSLKAWLNMIQSSKNLYIVFRFASSIERVRWNRWIQSALNENFSFFLILFPL